jgi:hypothetical protein
LPERAHRMLAMPARRRAQRVEDPPLLRPFGRPPRQWKPEERK